MQKISDVEHFCNDKFEETPKQKVIDFTLGYLSKPAPNPNVYQQKSHRRQRSEIGPVGTLEYFFLPSKFQQGRSKTLLNCTY